MSAESQTIGRYRILERVGRGGMGMLYRGIDPVLDREVAIKMMSAGIVAEDDDDARNRFFREARAAAKLQHRNIVTIFEFAEEHGVPYIVMEFLRGQSLTARMKSGPPLTLDQKLDVVTELCTGLEFAHENGVVHRDVKPANVWLLEDGSVKLLDFGIAKVASSTFTRHGDVLGSASYMSPEQVSGGEIDGRADIFSAAVLLYELLAGRRPFESDSPTSTILRIIQEPPRPLEQFAPDVPAPLVAAVNRGLQKSPADRYQTAGDFAAELQLIRMSLQSTGDTIFSSDPPFGETMYAPAPSQRTLAVEAPLRRHDEVPQQSAHMEAPVTQPATTWLIAGASVAVLLILGFGWLAVSRSPASPLPAEAQSEPVERSQKPAAPPVAPPLVAPTRNDAGSPQEAPPAPPTAVLQVKSDPDGASIDVDGKSTGLTTPAELSIGSPPPKRIRLTKKGFQSVDGAVTNDVLKAGAVSYRLTPAEVATVKVSVAGTYAFEVIDGTTKRVLSAAASSHELSVAPPRVLRLRAPEYLLDYPVKVDVGSGRTMEVQAPDLGKISIRSAMELCQVSLNGHELGLPTVNAQLAAGTYAVQLKCPDGQVARGSVTVLAGQSIIAKVP